MKKNLFLRLLWSVHVCVCDPEAYVTEHPPTAPSLQPSPDPLINIGLDPIASDTTGSFLKPNLLLLHNTVTKSTEAAHLHSHTRPCEDSN